MRTDKGSVREKNAFQVPDSSFYINHSLRITDREFDSGRTRSTHGLKIIEEKVLPL